MIKIAVIDDQERYLLNWKICLEGEAEVHCFFHHIECFKHYEQSISEVNKLAYIISDRFVPQYDALRDNFAFNFCKRFPNFKGKILLSSSAHKAHEKVGRGFHLSIGKRAQSLSSLEKMLSINSFKS